MKLEFGAYLDHSYKDHLLSRLNMEPVLLKLMMQERKLKERMIRESLHPFTRWFLLRFKWSWLVRHYRYEQESIGEKLVMRLYRKDKLIRTEELDRRPITFRRFSSLGVSPE